MLALARRNHSTKRDRGHDHYHEHQSGAVLTVARKERGSRLGYTRLRLILSMHLLLLQLLKYTVCAPASLPHPLTRCCTLSRDVM